MIKRWIAACALLVSGTSCAQENVSIAVEGNVRRVTTPAYTATVTANGAISSLQVKGQEFLRPQGASRGAYFYQSGSIDLTQIEQPNANVVTASGEKANARFEFLPKTLRWTLSNTTDKHMNFFVVLDPAVVAGRSESGEWRKPSVNGAWKNSTWFRDKAKLEISGATRVWGPWNGLTQVWEATLSPKETRVVELAAGTPDATETAKINELAGTTPAGTQAAITLPSFFSDNMVLQREMANPFWGTASAGETITVTVQNQTKRATADAQGKWKVLLDPLPVGGPYQITVKGKNTITLNNVLCGDVWICSGQSNMAWTMNEARDGAEAAKSANDPQLRLFKADMWASETPRTNVAGRWVDTNPKSAGSFSAVGYFFGQTLRKELDVPIGLISTAWGGTQIESWLSPESLKADPDYPAIAAREAKFVADYPSIKAAHDEWQQAAEAAKAAGQPVPAQPRRPIEPGSRFSNNTPSALYFGMNVPMAPLAVRGVAWYQGEANVSRSFQYRRLFPLMINDWRKLWGRPDLPFVWVQIPNIGPTPPQPTGSGWAEMREAQAMALSLPLTAMATTIELGDAKDIHPRYKQEVGRRLALATLQRIYGRNVAGSGPVYAGMKIEGNRIRLNFNEVHGGLVAKDDEPLKGFSIAGENQKFYWADAKIEGDTVVVSSPEVPNPIAVRYGWADTPIVNLYNKAGLPATPFRTDDWPGWTVPNK